jgi:hypothetical protein
MATRKERQKRGQKQLKKKLKLERKLSAKMRKFFRKQNAQFLELQEEYGITIDAANNQDELNDILAEHYRATADVFQPDIVDEFNRALEDAGEPTVDKDDPELLGALLFFILSNSRQSAQWITDTSNSEIGAALTDADDDARAAHRTLQARNIPRANTIAATETQKAAEGTKQLIAEEMEGLAGAAAGVALLMRTIKIWITRMDARVRPPHQAAEFQEVLLRDPFLVGGEFLMHPGDNSLGASAWNTINCRCNSIIETVVA